MDEEKIVNHAKYLYPYILRNLDSGFSGLILSSKHKSKVLTLFLESASKKSKLPSDRARTRGLTRFEYEN